MTCLVYLLAHSSPGLDAFELSFFGLGPIGPDEPEDSLWLDKEPTPRILLRCQAFKALILAAVRRTLPPPKDRPGDGGCKIGSDGANSSRA